MNAGSKISLEDVYRAEAPRLWRALVLHTGDREAASDAVAEAFAQAIRRGAAIRDPAAWVWKTAYRFAQGASKRMPTTTPMQVDADPGAVSDEVIDLVRALRRLTPHQRGAVVLRYYGGYSAREIAQILGSTASAVGVHLFRARNRLRRELGDVTWQDPGGPVSLVFGLGTGTVTGLRVRTPTIRETVREDVHPRGLAPNIRFFVQDFGKIVSIVPVRDGAASR